MQNSDYQIYLEPQVKKYLKKMKDKKLKERFITLIFDEIALSPKTIGQQKKGNLSEYWVANLRYQKTDYRIAYTIIDEKIIPILLAGTHENFYEQLKRML